MHLHNLLGSVQPDSAPKVCWPAGHQVQLRQDHLKSEADCHLQHGKVELYLSRSYEILDVTTKQAATYSAAACIAAAMLDATTVPRLRGRGGGNARTDRLPFT